MMKIVTLALALAFTAAAPATAQTVNPLESEALMKKAINDPGTAYTFYGSGFTQKVIKKDPDVPGGEFVRVEVSRAGAHPWDVGAQYAINRPIKTGDVLFFAVYLRAPNLKDGESTMVPGSGVSQGESPYAPIAVADARVTNQWNAFYASAKATTGWQRGQARAGLQLASDKQVIDLGPLIVLDLGPDYDINSLPHN